MEPPSWIICIQRESPQKSGLLAKLLIRFRPDLVHRGRVAPAGRGVAVACLAVSLDREKSKSRTLDHIGYGDCSQASRRAAHFFPLSRSRIPVPEKSISNSHNALRHDVISLKLFRSRHLGLSVCREISGLLAKLLIRFRPDLVHRGRVAPAGRGVAVACLAVSLDREKSKSRTLDHIGYGDCSQASRRAAHFFPLSRSRIPVPEKSISNSHNALQHVIRWKLGGFFVAYRAM